MEQLSCAIRSPSWFAWLTVFWLWLTVVFANLAEAVAEGRGKAQAESLRETKADTMARRLTGWEPGTPGREEEVAAPLLRQVISWWSRPARSSRVTVT